MKKRRDIAPDRLSESAKRAIVRPAVEGLIAFRLERGTEGAFYSVASHLFVGLELIQIVARHRHLRPEMDAARLASQSIFRRQALRTVQEPFWAAKPEELDAWDVGLQVYRALLDASPGPQVLRAMRRVQANLPKLLADKEITELCNPQVAGSSPARGAKYMQ